MAIKYHALLATRQIVRELFMEGTCDSNPIVKFNSINECGMVSNTSDKSKNTQATFERNSASLYSGSQNSLLCGALWSVITTFIRTVVMSLCTYIIAATLCLSMKIHCCFSGIHAHTQYYYTVCPNATGGSSTIHTIAAILTALALTGVVMLMY